MKGSEAKLLEYMEGAKKRFVIPVYQRNYDWKTENCKQLFDDLVKVVNSGRNSHFFGSIVSSYQPNGRYTEYLIIDGQQRLTTISLLLLAMYNLITEGKVIPETETMAQEILEDYLVDKHKPKETRVKLKPVKNDRSAFEKLFDAEDENDSQSNLTYNYEYFYNRIQKEQITIDQLYDALFSLEIINIELTQDDNPQLIFESLNSTGLALSEGDKIRNYILMGLPAKEQNDYYEKYWNRIEICTNYEVSLFIRDYLSVKQQSIPAFSKVYVTFKNYVEDESIEIETLLKDMYAYARWYEILIKGKTSDKALNACIDRLNRLETTITRPFFLEVLGLYEKKNLSIEDVRRIFLITETYLFRRFVCEYATNVLNKVFVALHREIVKYDGTTDNYLEKFIYALRSKVDRAAFPNDDEFIEALGTRPVYAMNSKNKVYILERYENYGIIEDKDIYRHVEDGAYSIEHIMPQHLTTKWAEDLGSDYEEIHETWLHRLANLTLTGYNSKYSNSSFVDKKTMDMGFAQSGLRLNMWIAQKDKWTLDELEERNAYLKQQALIIWSMPESTYKPEVKPLEFCTLNDEEVELSGRDIARFTFGKADQPVKTWVEMLEQVLKTLHETDKSILAKYSKIKDVDEGLPAFVRDNKDSTRGFIEIDKDIYVIRNTSTPTKIFMLRKLFKEYGANPEDLVFYLKDVKDVPDTSNARYELRIQYWEYALKFIHEAHESCYKNVKPSKDNWISGYFGISGFSIGCVANIDEARIDFTLSSFDKDRNKEAFDYLVSKKKEIEDKLGETVEWQRSDDRKASYVVYRLKNVSINNREDWPKMAQFHAEWSKKFYDAVVPHLKEWSENRSK